MSSEQKKLICKCCGALLGVIDGDRFEFRRGGIQVSYAGRGHIHIVCYRSTCRALNYLRLPILDAGDPEDQPWQPSSEVPEKLCCINCGVLLGMKAGDRFEVQRGKIQVSYRGRGHIYIVCYGRECETLNYLKLPVDVVRRDPGGGRGGLAAALQ